MRRLKPDLRGKCGDYAGEPQRDAQTLAVDAGSQGDGGAVALGDPPHDGEPKAAASSGPRCAGRGATIEAVENPFAILQADPGTVVPYFQQRRTVVGTNEDVDAPSVTAIAHGVVDQV